MKQLHLYAWLGGLKKATINSNHSAKNGIDISRGTGELATRIKGYSILYEESSTII